jgi:two-component sensor histidine kinase
MKSIGCKYICNSSVSQIFYEIFFVNFSIKKTQGYRLDNHASKGVKRHLYCNRIYKTYSAAYNATGTTHISVFLVFWGKVLKLNFIITKFKTLSLLKQILILIFICLSHWVNAQNLNLSFNHFGREGGLSNNNPFSFLADSHSFLWVGTFNGLNRFDGSTCRVYKPFNSSINGLSISNMIEDKQSDLWFSTESGLRHYVRQTDTFEEIDFIKDGKIRQYHPFYVDNQNRIWLIVFDKGIYVYNPKDKTVKIISNKLAGYAKVSSTQPFQKVHQIFYTDNQSGLHLLSLKDEKIVQSTSFFNGKNQPSLNLSRYFFVENDSLVWLTNNDFGLIKLNYQRNHFQFFNRFQGNQIKALTTVAFRPKSTQLFIGSAEFGVMVFDTKLNQFVQQFKHSATNPNSIKANWVEDVLIDEQQNIFLNVLGWGIDFTNLNTSNTEQWLSKEDMLKLGFEENSVNYSFIHKNKIIVKLQQGGVLILDTKGNVLEHKKDFPAIDYIFQSSDKILYACGFRGLFVLDDDFRVKETIPIKYLNIPNEQIYNLVEESPNHFIIGSEKGFYSMIKEGKNYKIDPIDELKNTGFTTNKPLYFDAETKQLFISSNWWTAFQIIKKENGKWKVQAMKKLEANVFNIVPDKMDKHKIWLCTNKGLLKFDTKIYQYEIWDEAKGLPDNSVTTILPNKNGDFWLITNRGISFYNKKLNIFKNFSEKDGAKSSEYDWYGTFYLPDKRMMFAGTDGITVIDPKQLITNTIPKLYITDIKVNEKSVVTPNYIGESAIVHLKPDESSFSIDFVALDYSKPENIRLQYQLQGFDNQWISVKNPANIHLSNVPDNDYIFKIRALADDGTVAAERSLKISIATPFWRTWWFRLLVFALFVGLAYAFYRYRINQLVAMQAVRNRISTDLHDEIGATLSGIGILSTIAKQQVEESHPANALLGRITDDALTVGNAIDDIVWSINPKNDELSNVVARMSRHAAELFDAKSVDYQIITPENTETIKLSMEERRDVYLIFKEAINNLLKYAQCTKVRIEMNVENRKFHLLIADNGIGFDTTKITNRNGIMNMKNRAVKLKGDFRIDSKLGEGTKVELEFLI